MDGVLPITGRPAYLAIHNQSHILRIHTRSKCSSGERKRLRLATAVCINAQPRAAAKAHGISSY